MCLVALHTSSMSVVVVTPRQHSTADGVVSLQGSHYQLIFSINRHTRLHFRAPLLTALLIFLGASPLPMVKLGGPPKVMAEGAANAELGVVESAGCELWPNANTPPPPGWDRPASAAAAGLNWKMDCGALPAPLEPPKLKEEGADGLK